MALYARLIGADPGVDKIPIHSFMAAVGENERGVKLSEAQIATMFNLTAPEQVELATLLARIKPARESYCLSGHVVLTNVGATFDANVGSQALPFVYIEKNGVTRLDLEVRVRKAAAQTGTIDFVLRNDTDSNDALSSTNATGGSLTDSASAGDHTLNAHRVFPSALSPGVVKLRLQVKSTTAADDPIFLGAALLITRADRMSSLELHEALLLAEAQLAYTTETLLKARLGVS